MTYEEIKQANSTLTYEERLAKRQRIDYGLGLISKKWFYNVLSSIACSRIPISFSEIAKEYNISPRALSNTLTCLEENELIIRIVYDTKPIQVKYKITLTGQRFIAEIGEVINKFVQECIPENKVTGWDGYDYKDNGSLEKAHTEITLDNMQ